MFGMIDVVDRWLIALSFVRRYTVKVVVIHKPRILDVSANQITQFQENFKKVVAVKVMVIHMPLI